MSEIKDNDCNQCDKSFTTERFLKIHIESEHEGIRHKCDKCNKEFKFNNGLRDHINSAHDKVRYQCNQCA